MDLICRAHDRRLAGDRDGIWVGCGGGRVPGLAAWLGGCDGVHNQFWPGIVDPGCGVCCTSSRELDGKIKSARWMCSAALLTSNSSMIAPSKLFSTDLLAAAAR